MFGLFKKKEAPQPEQASANESIMDRAAALLNLQLMLCRSQDGYMTGLDSNFVRGYFVGYFDCSLQKLGHRVRSDEEFAMLLVRGHAQLLGNDVGDTQHYTFGSLRLQDAPDFARGHAEGGNDCNDLLAGRRDKAFPLMRYFMEG